MSASPESEMARALEMDVIGYVVLDTDTEGRKVHLPAYGSRLIGINQDVLVQIGGERVWIESTRPIKLYSKEEPR